MSEKWCLDGRVLQRVAPDGKSFVGGEICNDLLWSTLHELVADARNGAQLQQLITDEIAQLRQWAVESLQGGWSTHQVRPMRARADELELMLARMQTRGVK